MNKRTVFITVMLISMFITSTSVWARPVSYPEAWTTMLMNNSERHSLHIHYSPSAKYSLGYKLEYWRGGQYSINALQMNNLLKRWNTRDSQANLYLKSGIGIARRDQGRFESATALAAFAGIAADWENRRFFIQYQNRYTEAGSIDKFFTQKARVGVTPYVGQYGDLHTWLMLEFDHRPDDGDRFTVTPLVRLFKGVHLVEIGMSNRSQVLLNWIVRY